MKYSILDKLAYDSYVKATENNDIDSIDTIYVDTEFVGDIKRFVDFHNEDKNNATFYYDMHKKTIRKLKLEKLNDNKK